VITTDEAWFYLNNSDGQSRVQYISRDQNRNVCQQFTEKSHPKGVMVWVGISAAGVTTCRFVEPGAKINSEYYINKILKPFIDRDVKKLYHNRDYIFQQDSAPSHRSKLTINYLTKRKVPFISPERWLPNSPDCAPCDYFLWGYLKTILRTKKISTIPQLKKAIKAELKKIPQDVINRALKSWPKRCRKIYYNKGLHIEKHN
jgi:histone-lysine N-methyltransferase SETMAR